MGKYQAYPEYKDSEGNWMGEVPSHWVLTSLKRVSDLSTGLTPPTSNEANYVDYNSGFSWVRPEDLNEGQAPTTASKFLSKNGWELMRVVPKSSTLICCIGTIGKTGYVQEDVSTNQQITSASFHYSPKYNYYLVKAAREVMEETATGNVIQILNSERLGGIPFLLLPKNEADKIASFLDHETAKIDTLIDKQQQLIQLLKEKCQAVISHAVTKGLNPSAPMRDSGVEWLGEVPEHWVLKSYRYAAKIYRGKFNHRPRNDPALYDGKYPFIQTGDIAQADKKITEYKQTLNERGIGVSQKFPAGTLVMAIAANIGDTAILDFEAYAPDSVVGFKPYDGIDLEFLRYSLKAALPALEQTSTQSTQANLNIDRIGAVKASFPTVAEQEEIVRLLDALHESYAIIEIKAKEAIELMQERRTALISAAVTGKIDVRNWESPTQHKIRKQYESFRKQN